MFEHLPNNRDNLTRILIKVSFLLVCVAILVGSICFGTYYCHSYSQQKLIFKDQAIFNNNSAQRSAAILKSQNSDYTAWLNLNGTQLNNPVFKTDDNSFYLNHNSLKGKSRYGSLFLDYRSDFSDKNAVVYGNSAKDGMMFATLNKLRELGFYKENYRLKLSFDDEETEYLIYSIFVLNSKKNQDNGRIYSVYQKEFYNEETFNAWVDEAKNRSLINTNIDVNYKDKILTLITSCEDFEDARLVVMARSERAGEIPSSVNINATVNPNPKFPKKWYDERNIKYPF